MAYRQLIESPIPFTVTSSGNIVRFDELARYAGKPPPVQTKRDYESVFSTVENDVRKYAARENADRFGNAYGPHNNISFQPNKVADEVVRKAGARISITNDPNEMPGYGVEIDRIVMPRPERFESTSEVYATIFHELGHWTGHASRLNRPTLNRIWDDLTFRMKEEVTAEMTSAYVTGALGICELERRAGYVKNWSTAFRCNCGSPVCRSISNRKRDLTTKELDEAFENAREAAKFILAKAE